MKVANVKEAEKISIPWWLSHTSLRPIHTAAVTILLLPSPLHFSPCSLLPLPSLLSHFTQQIFLRMGPQKSKRQINQNCSFCALRFTGSVGFQAFYIPGERLDAKLSYRLPRQHCLYTNDFTCRKILRVICVLPKPNYDQGLTKISVSYIIEESKSESCFHNWLEIKVVLYKIYLYDMKELVYYSIRTIQKWNKLQEYMNFSPSEISWWRNTFFFFRLCPLPLETSN